MAEIICEKCEKAGKISSIHVAESESNQFESLEKTGKSEPQRAFDAGFNQIVHMTNPKNDDVNQLSKSTEQFGIPVILRTSTRVSHMRGIVEMGDINKTKSTTKESEKDGHWLKGYFVKNPKEFVPVPANALTMHERLVEKEWSNVQ